MNRGLFLGAILIGVLASLWVHEVRGDEDSEVVRIERPQVPDAAMLKQVMLLNQLNDPNSPAGKMIGWLHIRELSEKCQKPEFQRAIKNLSKSPRLIWLAGAEIAWVVLISFLSMWWVRRTTGIFKAFVLRFGMTIILLAGVSIGIPWLVLGQPFQELVRVII